MSSIPSGGSRIDIKIDEASMVLSATDTALRELLSESFPGMFEERCFFKQEPHNRIVAHISNKLVAQVGIDRRVINVAGNYLKIVGIVDLCVAVNYRSQGIGRALLKSVENRSKDRDFAVLMADNPTMYREFGYVSLKPALTRWLAIEDLRSHSVIERDLSGV